MTVLFYREYPELIPAKAVVNEHGHLAARRYKVRQKFKTFLGLKDWWWSLDRWLFTPFKISFSSSYF